MLAYKNVFRPTQVRLADASLAQTPSPIVPPSSITPGERTAAIALGAAQAGFGVVASWVGVRAGMRERGIFSALGYVVAAGGALFAGTNLLGTLGLISKPA